VTGAAPAGDLAAFGPGLRVIEGYAPGPARAGQYIVVATQGRGDEAALRAALAVDTRYAAFVGSHAKIASLRQKLAAEVPADRLEALRAPAGLNIGAITPEEIALSILAEMVLHRRHGQRQPITGPQIA
jgi:xanthine dehydrogenase accessory factor